MVMVPVYVIPAAANLQQILEPLPKAHIYQSINIGETATGGCCREANRYTLYASAEEGHAGKNGLGFMYETDQGCLGCLERQCCKGFHGMKLEVMNNSGQIINTIERPGCCSGKPCLWCCSCAGPCLEELNVYEGAVTGGPGKIQAANPGKLLFSTRQRPCQQSICSVKMDVFAPGANEPAMTVHAPCVFGGCKSLFCDDHFPIEDSKGVAVGHLKKKSPESIGACFKEICTDADDYQVDFGGTTNGQATNGTQKLAMLTAALQADFMLFEQDKGPCFCEDPCALDVACTIFNCYVCGLFRPCILRSKYLRRTVFFCSIICPFLQPIPCCAQVDYGHMFGGWVLSCQAAGCCGGG
jgi:hypothetical protein